MKITFDSAFIGSVVAIGIIGVVTLFMGIIAVNSIQPHQGKVIGVASYICCLGSQQFAIQLSDGTSVNCSAGSMAASDIITITNLKVGDVISMFGTCHDVKVLS